MATASAGGVAVGAGSRQTAEEAKSGPEAATDGGGGEDEPRQERRLSFEYEVWGKVQGVFFRKHTHKTANKLGLVGFVQNTDHGTVVGKAQGLESSMRKFRRWLMTKGSPKSRIDRTAFTNEEELPDGAPYEYDGFQIVR